MFSLFVPSHVGPFRSYIATTGYSASMTNLHMHCLIVVPRRLPMAKTFPTFRTRELVVLVGNMVPYSDQ